MKIDDTEIAPDWHEYEARKASLRAACLEPEEYDRALRQLCDEFGI